MSILRISTFSALMVLTYPCVSNANPLEAPQNNPQSATSILQSDSLPTRPDQLDNASLGLFTISDLLQSGSSSPEQDVPAFPLETSDLISQTDSSNIAGDTLAPSQAKKSLLIDPLVLPPSGSSRKASPGSTFGVPSAYGASWRSVFVGGGVIGPGGFDLPQGRQDVDTDGSISFGAGFGDSAKTIGVELNFAIISLRDAFADSGSVGFKVHKVFPELDNLAVAVGWSNPITWGDANDAEETVYGVLTKAFDLRSGKDNALPITVTTGIGTGAYRSTGAINDNTNAPNFFGSVGLKVIPEVSLISTWSGNQLNMGVSAAPFSQVPFTLTLGAGDVTNNRGNGVRFLMSGGFGFKF